MCEPALKRVKVEEMFHPVTLMATCAMNSKMTSAASAEITTLFGDALTTPLVWKKGKLFFGVTPSESTPLSAMLALHCVERVFVSIVSLDITELELPLEDPVLAMTELVKKVPLQILQRAARIRAELTGDEDPPRFKIFCKRKGVHFNGSKGDISREDIAAAVGGAVQDATGWGIDLRNPTMNIHFTCSDEGVFFGIQIARQQTTTNYLAVTGETGLHPTVSWFMARCASPSPGDIVVDVCCGRGVILSEAAGRWPSVHYIGIDVNHDQLTSAQKNFKAGNRSKRIDLIQGDLTLPALRSGSVSAVVADLPFGKQHGSLEENITLYPQAFAQCERILQPDGVFVMLTSTSNIDNVKRAITATSLVLVRRRWLKLGLLDAHVYIFKKGTGSEEDKDRLDWTGKGFPFEWEGKSWAETYAKERPGLIAG